LRGFRKLERRVLETDARQLWREDPPRCRPFQPLDGTWG